MAMKLVFRDTAFKHGLTREQITYALSNLVKCKRVFNKKFDNHNIWAIALLPNGNDCEIVYMYDNIETIVVFHAMSPTRKSFSKEIERK